MHILSVANEKNFGPVAPLFIGLFVFAFLSLLRRPHRRTDGALSFCAPAANAEKTNVFLPD